MKWTRDIQRANADEWRAASSIARALGVLPTLVDDNSRDGMVDLSLEVNGRVEIAEVTSTTDGQFAEAHQIVWSFLDELQGLYDGQGRWMLGFGRGWKPVRRSKRDPRAVIAMMKEVESVSAGRVTPDDHVSFSPQPELGFEDFTLTLFSYPDVAPSIDYSLSSKASSKGSYICALQDFLSRSDLIDKKVQKLVQEATRLSAARRHLFLLVSALGENGHLLPIRRDGEVWGPLHLPEGLDVLWLDGGTGVVARFDRESEWSYYGE